METLNELTLGFSFFIKIITNVQLGKAKISIKFISKDLYHVKNIFPISVLQEDEELWFKSYY